MILARVHENDVLAAPHSGREGRLLLRLRKSPVAPSCTLRSRPQIGILIPPSCAAGVSGPRRPQTHLPHALRNPHFLAAILDEATLLQLLRFNSAAIHLLGRHAVAVKLRALERDPEYVLVYLRHRDVVCVLSEFWRCWRNAHGGASERAHAAGLGAVGLDAGNLLGRAPDNMRLAHPGYLHGCGKVVFEYEGGAPGDLVLCDKGGLLDRLCDEGADCPPLQVECQMKQGRVARKIVGVCSLMNLRG